MRIGSVSFMVLVLVIAAGCGLLGELGEDGDKDPGTETDETESDDASDDPSDLDDELPPDDTTFGGGGGYEPDTSTPGFTYDTAYLLFAYVGGGTVTANAYTNAYEALTMQVQPFSAAPYSICDFTWTVSGTKPSAVATEPCRNDLGQACTFTLDVALTNGAETLGDCVAIFGYTLPSDGGDFTYGHTESYLGYGPSLLYFVTGGDYWLRTGYSEFDSATGSWEYLWPIGLYYYYL